MTWSLEAWLAKIHSNELIPVSRSVEHSSVSMLMNSKRLLRHFLSLEWLLVCREQHQVTDCNLYIVFTPSFWHRLKNCYFLMHCSICCWNIRNNSWHSTRSMIKPHLRSLQEQWTKPRSVFQTYLLGIICMPHVTTNSRRLRNATILYVAVVLIRPDSFNFLVYRNFWALINVGIRNKNKISVMSDLHL